MNLGNLYHYEILRYPIHFADSGGRISRLEQSGRNICEISLILLGYNEISSLIAIIIWI